MVLIKCYIEGTTEYFAKGGLSVRKIVVSIRNGLMAESITRALRNCGEFLPYQVSPEAHTSISAQCESLGADILLMEVSYAPGTTVEARLNEIRQVHSSNPGCKVVMLCDDNSAPEIAHKVTQFKKDRLIDIFFYTSVTENYLMSTLTSW